MDIINSYFQHGKNNSNFDNEKYIKRYEKVSNSLKGKGKNVDKKICLNCKIEYKSKNYSQIYCSTKCRNTSELNKKKISDRVLERVKNGTHKGWQSRNVESYPEKFFKKVLNNNGIKFETNKTIIKKEYNIEGNGNYFLDFYIKEGNIDLEIDGKQHEGRIEHDELRDRNLSPHFNIYRIKWKSINKEEGKEYIKQEIEKIINYYKMKTTYTYQQQQQVKQSLD